LHPLLPACERRLAAEIRGAGGPAVAPAAERLLDAGGKRLRPLLLLHSAPDATHGERLVAGAVAVELMHMATLVHDDLIDGARVRRGQPTVAAEDGPAAALCVGDALMARAFAVAAGTGSPQAVAVLARATLALTRGELHQERTLGDLALAEDAYLARCRDKTGALFGAACRLGALLGGGDRELQERLGAFGEGLGVAFQIVDDVLDIVGGPEATGKEAARTCATARSPCR
jgi:geranylgeranyl pyrophosphate synthase